MPLQYPRNLLVTFDAFGTLFIPRLPVSTQYALVAEQHGLVGMNEADISLSFRRAFKEESKLHPNYGKAAGMTPEEWWKRIITKTFRSLSQEELPPALAPALIHRFRTNIGYKLYPDVIPFLKALRHPRSDWPYHSTTIGVVTNSDSRVISILNSLKVGVKSYQPTTPNQDLARDQWGASNALIDFVVLSYDIGYEKPDKRIFDEAKRAASVGACAPAGAEWSCMHVGDDRDKDYHGARNAGWRGILVDRDGKRSKQQGDVVKDLADLTGILM